MTVEVVDYLPFLHAIPIAGLKAGAKFFAEDGPEKGRYGVRGFVQHPFGRSLLSNAPRGLPAWRRFSVTEVFCLVNARNEGSMRFEFNGKVWAEIPANVVGFVPLVRPVETFDAPTLIGEFLFDDLRPFAGLRSPESETGEMVRGLAQLAEKTRERNETWQRDPGRCSRDFVVNRVMSVLEDLVLSASTTPMVIAGFAGRAEIEFV